MMNLLKSRGGKLIRTIFVCSFAILMLCSAVYAEPVQVWSYIDDAGVPPAGTIKFIGFYTDDSKIQTEDSYNNTNNKWTREKILNI